MNPIHTIAAACGIALVAATAVAAPSLAATTSQPAPDTTRSVSETTFEQGDRIEGPFRTWTGPADDGRWNRWDLGNDRWFITPTEDMTTTPAGGLPFTYPAPGTEGPITPASDLGQCLSPTTNDLIVLSPCSGSMEQQWSILSDGTVTSIADPGSGISNDDQGGKVLVAASDPARLERLMLDATTPVTPEQDEPVLITGPEADTTIPVRPEFTGTGEVGADIVLRDDEGNEIGRTTVEDDGTWTIVPETDLTPGPLTVIAEQTIGDAEPTTDTRDYIVADPEDTPTLDPTLAGITGLGALALIGTTLTLRRRHA